MADRKHTSRTIRKEPVMGQHQAAATAAASAASSGSGGRGSGTKKRRITDAFELPPAAKMAVLDEATELPPFGFNIAVLEQRLKRRLGLEIAQVRSDDFGFGNRGAQSALPVSEHLNF